MNKYLKPEIEVLELTMVDVIETSGGGNKPGLNNGGAEGETGDITFPDYWD